MIAALDSFFRIRERGSSLRREVLGGITTFVTMAYIIVVNPAILEHAGIPRGPGTVATILATVFGCCLMGLYANRPIAVAPYMGENAFIAFSLSTIVVDGEPMSWQLRLGTVFVSGVAFLLLTVSGLRQWLGHAISNTMKNSFAVGIGLFLFLVGVNQAGIISRGVEGGPPVQIGNWHDLRVVLALVGFVLITTLLYWRVRGGIILGIAAIAAVGTWLGFAHIPDSVLASPWSEQYDVSKVALQLEIWPVLRLSYLHVLLTLFLVSFLDTLGTLYAVGSAGDMLDENGEFPEIERPMLVDSLACMFSALVGTSTSGAYIESTTGVKEGARTGLAAVVTGLLFAAAVFFIPIFEPMQQLAFAYAPALMSVGVLMFPAAARFDFADLTEWIPGFVTITVMVFTFNIANGLTAGLVFYPLFKLLTGRWRDLTWANVTLGALCACYFLFGSMH